MIPIVLMEDSNRRVDPDLELDNALAHGLLKSEDVLSHKSTIDYIHTFKSTFYSFEHINEDAIERYTKRPLFVEEFQYIYRSNKDAYDECVEHSCANSWIGARSLLAKKRLQDIHGKTYE